MSEKFYDEEIAPALKALADRCQERGLSFCALVEYGPGDVGLTVRQAEGASMKFGMAFMGARAFGSADSLIMALMRHGREHGHNSMCLHQLGVPTSPALATPPAQHERGE